MLSARSITLNNGLQVVTVPQPHLHSATACFTVRCGSRHETPEQWGLSHLLEHMLFRGCARYPNGRALAHVFERAGGSLSAATWRDHTSYTSPLHPTHLKPVLAALADMMITPHFNGLELERVIVEEELQSDLDEHGADIDISNLSRAAIWRDHPMGRRITGALATLQGFTLEQVRQHHRTHYVGSNAVLCVAGRINPAEVEALAADLFGPMPLGKPAGDGPAPAFNPPTPLLAQTCSGSQIALQLSFQAPPDTHADFCAAALLASILDDGMTSRLPHALCEQRGLVYELTSGLDCYADGGLYDIEMLVAPRRAASALQATLEEIDRLVRGGVTQEELEAARQRHLHELEFRVDSPEELAQQFGVSSLFNRDYQIDAEIDRLQKVSVADLSRVAMRIFCAGTHHATLRGPLQRADMPGIAALLKDLRGGTLSATTG